MKKVFILYCDDGFYRFYDTILKSIELFEPDATTVLHLINSKKKSNNIVNQYIDIPDDKVKPAYIICHKIQYMLETMRTTEGDIFVELDIDMVLNRPLDIDGIWDVGGFVIHPTKVAGGIIMAQKTDMAYKFLNDYNAQLIEPPYFWDKDQPLFAKLYHEYIEQGMVWKQVGRDYLDPENKTESYIWSAHKSEYGDKTVRLEKFKQRLEQ